MSYVNTFCHRFPFSFRARFVLSLFAFETGKDDLVFRLEDITNLGKMAPKFCGKPAFPFSSAKLRPN